MTHGVMGLLEALENLVKRLMDTAEWIPVGSANSVAPSLYMRMDEKEKEHQR